MGFCLTMIIVIIIYMNRRLLTAAAIILLAGFIINQSGFSFRIQEIFADDLEEQLRGLTPAQREKFLEQYADRLLEAADKTEGIQSRDYIKKVVDDNPDKFTPREKKVLEIYRQNPSQKEVAEKLGVKFEKRGSIATTYYHPLIRALNKVAEIQGELPPLQGKKLAEQIKRYWFNLSPREQKAVSTKIDLETGEIKTRTLIEMGEKLGWSRAKAYNSYRNAVERVKNLVRTKALPARPPPTPHSFPELTGGGRYDPEVSSGFRTRGKKPPRQGTGTRFTGLFNFLGIGTGVYRNRLEERQQKLEKRRAELLKTIREIEAGIRKQEDELRELPPSLRDAKKYGSFVSREGVQGQRGYLNRLENDYRRTNDELRRLQPRVERARRTDEFFSPPLSREPLIKKPEPSPKMDD